MKLVTTFNREFSGSKYYGVDTKWRRGFIGREAFGRGFFKVYCPWGITEGNDFSYLSKESIKDIVWECAFRNMKVYEFNTYTSLFRWVSKKIN